MSLSESDKKVLKKQKRSQISVQKQTGIVCCQHSTKNIAICNAGLSNGLSEEQILLEFVKYGPLENTVMLPGKSCCFVTYSNIKDAENAFKNINGKLNIGEDNKPIYLGFTEEVPANMPASIDVKPDGLIVLENFIDEEEENDFLTLHDFDTVNENVMKHRQVVHYGFEFCYDTNNVDRQQPLEQKIPKKCDVLWERLKCHGIDFIPDQLTVNCYKPGQGIPPHVDTHSAFEDPIVSLSLGSNSVMEFKTLDGRHVSVVLPRRSLTVMSGESRYNWMHGIIPRKYDIVPTEIGRTVHVRGTRVSFTFRKIREDKCSCIYPDLCDSYKNRAEITNQDAVNLETNHVHNVYENIASHFSDTRHKPWPNVLNFVNSIGPGSLLLDIGCGNGKYLGQNKDIINIGCDTSLGLINVCKERGFQVLQGNCLNIPFRNNIANAVISIAVIHHLATKERRLRALEEMIRVLQINGEALVYVWAKDQNRNNKTSYLMQDRKNRKETSNITRENVRNVNVINNVSLPVHTNRTQFQHQDLLVPWKLKQEKVNEEEFLRYYHVFEEGELETMCKTFKNITVIKSYYDQGNWCIIFKKVSDHT